MNRLTSSHALPETVVIPLEDGTMTARLLRPDSAKALVLLIREPSGALCDDGLRKLAPKLADSDMAALILDLREESPEASKAEPDLARQASRLQAAARWAREYPRTETLPMGCIASGEEIAPALFAAVQLGGAIRAVVSLGGRLDLAETVVPDVTAATLLVVGGLDERILGINQGMFRLLKSRKRLVVLPDASHAFEEPAKLHEAGRLAVGWLRRQLKDDAESERSAG